MLRVVLVAAALVAVVCDSAQAQSPPVRLAAPSDCERSPNCVPGFRRAYGLDPTASLLRSVFVDVGTPLVARVVTLATETQVRDYIAQTPAALCLLDRALVGPLHVAAYEGVGCTRATIRNGTYPAGRPLGVVTRGKPRGALARFLRWARTSRKARQVITTRYLTL